MIAESYYGIPGVVLLVLVILVIIFLAKRV